MTGRELAEVFGAACIMSIGSLVVGFGFFFLLQLTGELIRHIVQVIS